MGAPWLRRRPTGGAAAAALAALCLLVHVSAAHAQSSTGTPSPASTPSFTTSPASTAGTVGGDAPLSTGSIVAVAAGTAGGVAVMVAALWVARGKRHARHGKVHATGGNSHVADTGAFDGPAALPPLSPSQSRALEDVVRAATGVGGGVSWASEPSLAAARAAAAQVYASDAAPLTPPAVLQALADALMEPPAAAPAPASPGTPKAAPVPSHLRASLTMYNVAGVARSAAGAGGRKSSGGGRGSTAAAAAAAGASAAGALTPATAARLLKEALQCAVHVAAVHTITEAGEDGSAGHAAVASTFGAVLRRGCEVIATGGESATVLGIVSAAAGAFLAAGSPPALNRLPATLDDDALWSSGSDALHTALRYRYAAAVQRANPHDASAAIAITGATRSPSSSTSGQWFVLRRKRSSVLSSMPSDATAGAAAGATMMMHNPLRKSSAATGSPPALPRDASIITCTGGISPIAAASASASSMSAEAPPVADAHA